MAIQYLGTTISGVSGDTKPTPTANEKGVIFIETDTNKIYQWDTDSWNEIVLSDASTSAKGIASFSSDNFAASSGVITIKNSGVILGTETTGNYVATVAGTSNEITVSGSTGAVTISLPDDVTIGGDLVITGDLTVSGDTVTANIATLTIEDPLLYLANGQASSPAFDSGFVVERGSSANVAFLWDESTDEFVVANVPAGETGTTAGNVTIDSYARFRAGNSAFTANAAASGITFVIEASDGADRIAIAPDTSIGANYEFFAVNQDTITLTSSINQAYQLRLVQPEFSGAYTITQAATVYIEGAASVTASAAITNNYALWVDAGASRFDGDVGMGALFSTSGTTPEAELHVASAAYGGPAANAASLIVAEASGSGYISLLAPTIGGLLFGDAANNAIGSFNYIHSSNSFTWNTNGSLSLTLSGAASPTLHANGPLTISTDSSSLTLAPATDLIVTNSSATNVNFFTVRASDGNGGLNISPITQLASGNATYIIQDFDEITLTGSNPTTYSLVDVFRIQSNRYTATNAGQTITDARTLYLEPVLTGSAGGNTPTITTASTLYISSGGTAGATNYALWSDSGDNRFDGRVYFYDRGGEYIESNGGSLKLVGEAWLGESTGGNFTMRAAGGGMYLQSAENMFFDASQYFTWRDQDNSDNEILKLNSATAAVTFEFQQETTMSTSTGVFYIDGDDGLELSTTAGALTLDPATYVIIPTTKELVLGHTAPSAVRDVWDNTPTPQLQVIGVETSMAIIANNANTDTGAASRAGSLVFVRSLSNTLGSTTLVTDGIGLGGISWVGADGSNYFSQAASITAFVDGASGSTDMPGRIVFSTTADGGDGATERMRINSAGNVSIGNVVNVGDTYPDSQLHVLKEDANYRTISDVLHLTHMTTGTATDGLATGLLFSTEVDAGHYIRAGARIAMVMTDVSNGSQNGDLVFETSNNNSDFAELNTYGTGALSASERMRITSAGNVGIGTATPLDALEVSSAGHTVVRIAGGTSSSDPTIEFWDRQTAQIGNIRALQTSGTIDRLVMGTANSEQLVILLNGNVGIGTSSPEGRLHVHTATAGTVTASDKSSLVVEGSGTTHVAISILGPATAEKVLYFGEPDEDNGGNGEIRGWIGYNGHDDSPSNALTFGIQATPRLLFGGGGSTFAFQQDTIISSTGALTLDPTTELNLTLTPNINNALQVTDGTTTLQRLDTRNTTANLITHTFDSPNQTIPDGATAVHQLVEFAAYDITLEGQTQVTTSQRTVNIESTQLRETGGAVTVAQAATFRIAGAPYPFPDVTITEALALYVDSGKSRFDGDIDYYGSLTNASDERLKANIQTIPSALSKVSQMRGVSFNRRYDNKNSDVGVLAQEMELIAPEVVSSGLGPVLINEGEADEELITNVKGVNYSSLIAYLIEAIKELKGEIDELKKS